MTEEEIKIYISEKAKKKPKVKLGKNASIYSKLFLPGREYHSV